MSTEWEFPQRRPRTTNSSLPIIIGLSVAGALIIGFIFYAAIIRQRPIALPPAKVESLAERRQAMIRAFGGGDVGASEQELGRIKQLFDAILKAAADEDDEAMASNVDFDRHMLAIKYSGAITKMSRNMESSTRRTLKDRVFISDPWTDYAIARVD